MRISQAGLEWSEQKFWMISAALGLFGFGAAFMVGGGLLGAAGIGFAMGLGLPRWLLGFLKKRREKAFLKALPDAVDVIVRGIKAGLPLFESLKAVVNDASEPLRSEFLALIETQAIGMPFGEACARLYAEEAHQRADARARAAVLGAVKDPAAAKEHLGNLRLLLDESPGDVSAWREAIVGPTIERGRYPVG